MEIENDSLNPFKSATQDCISLLHQEIESWNHQDRPQGEYSCIRCIKFLGSISSTETQEVISLLQEIIVFEPASENYRWFVDIKLAAVNALHQRSPHYIGPAARHLNSNSTLSIISQILVQASKLNTLAVQISHMPELISSVLEKIEARGRVDSEEAIAAILQFAKTIPSIHVVATGYQWQQWQDIFIKTVRVLGSLKNPRTITVLKQILLMPAAPTVWPEVIKCFGEIGGKEAVEAACSVFARRWTHDFQNGLYRDVDHDKLCYLATDVVFKDNSELAFNIFLQSLEDAAEFYGWNNFYDDEFIWLRSDVGRCIQENRYENADLFFEVVRDANISDRLRFILLEWMPDYIRYKPEYINLIEQKDYNQTPSNQTSSSNLSSSFSTSNSKIITFQWEMESDQKDCVYARSGLSSDSHSLHAMTEVQAKEHFWMKYQVEILSELQKYLDQGYHPVTEVGASCVIVELKSAQTRSRSYLKGLFQAIFIDEWCFIGARIKLRR